MAESIVEKIKQKMGGIQLPFMKKKAAAEEAGEAAVSSTDKTNVGIQAPPADDATEANDLNDMQAPAKPKMVLFRPIGKTKFTPVHVLVALAVLYFGYDMMMGEQASEEVAQETVAPPKPKRKRKKPEESAPTDTATATDPATAATTPEPTPTMDPNAPVDNIDVAQATPTPEAPKSEDTAAIDNLDVKDINTAAEKIEKEEALKPKETPEPESTETASSETNAQPGGDEGSLSMNTGEANTSDVSPEPVKETDLASDLLKNLSDSEETKTEDVAKDTKESSSPPDYTRVGRGLVYNCKDGHWACVARDEYLTCKSNRKWNEAHSKQKECYEVSVYATDRDCATAQKIKVDSVAQTDFCK